MNHIDKIKLGTKFDRRTKLTADDKLEIRKQYLEGNISQRELARIWGVDRRLIVFAIYPERYEHSKAMAKIRRKDGRYYNKDKHRLAIQKIRAYKKQLISSGKIN